MSEGVQAAIITLLGGMAVPLWFIMAGVWGILEELRKLPQIKGAPDGTD